MLNILTYLEFNPQPYKFFHLLWLLITIGLSIVFCLFWGKKHNEKLDNRITLIFGIILIVGEIFKQILLYKIKGFYEWHQFPYQFCSLAMYVSMIVPFLKKSKVQEALYIFLALCGLFAGITVMAEPSGVFHYVKDYGTPILVIHSCVWHSSMIILGCYLVVSRDYGHKYKELLNGYLVFIASVFLAIILNEVLYFSVFKNSETPDNYFNGFYISSHYISSLVVFKDVQPIVPYPIFVLFYLFAFFLGLNIVWGAIYLIKFLINKFNKKNLEM